MLGLLGLLGMLAMLALLGLLCLLGLLAWLDVLLGFGLTLAWPWAGRGFAFACLVAWPLRWL